MKRSAFTLVELLISILIISILAVLVFPNARDAFVRAQVVKCQTDLKSIESALNAYFVDWGNYPPTNLVLLSPSMPIDRVSLLQNPVAYLSGSPYAPWYKKMGEIRHGIDSGIVKDIGIQNNYTLWVSTSSFYDEIPHGALPDWSLSCGGPLTINVSSKPSYWYSPTNGVYSEGGFWLDSDGVSSI